MTRLGIAPKFSAIAALYAVPAGWLTHRYRELFLIECVSYRALACFASVLLVAGAAVYAKALLTFSADYRKGALVTRGPFSVVRHPIYAAWILLIVPGVVLLFRSWLLLPVPLIAYAAFKVFIHEEDDLLRQKFGQSYLKYRLTTDELFPFWRSCVAETHKSEDVDQVSE